MRARWIRLGSIPPAQYDAICARLAAAQSAAAPPVLLWGEDESHYLFTLVAPLKFAPGRVARWVTWALAPAIATYRQFGLPAYLDDGGVWLHGRRIAEATVRTIGACAVVGSSFLLQFPTKCVAIASRDLEDAFRLRLEAQHGWQFDHSWPTFTEKRASLAAL